MEQVVLKLQESDLANAKLLSYLQRIQYDSSLREKRKGAYTTVSWMATNGEGLVSAGPAALKETVGACACFLGHELGHNRLKDKTGKESHDDHEAYADGWMGILIEELRIPESDRKRVRDIIKSRQGSIY